MDTVLDTRLIHPDDRQNYWSTGISMHFFPICIETVGTPLLEAHLSGGQIGPVGIRFIRGRPHRVARTASMVAASDPECILLYLLIGGSIRLEQDNRSCVLQPGDLACHDTSRPSAFESHDTFEVLMFSVPKWFIGLSTPNITRYTATRMARDDGHLPRLVAPFLVNLARTVAGNESLSSRDSEASAEMLVSMLRSIYAEPTPLEGRSHPDVLLVQMQQYALDRLHIPSLGPDSIAQAHFVSTRYVHKLFATSGTSASAWIRERRLEAAAQELRESPAMTISVIATKWGYRNPGSFSRAFREMYGCSPRDLRQSQVPGKNSRPLRGARAS
ncbi:Transcriptional activator NphR (plasmid) [Corynebacterium occultum]|uniref:Transcriptional activator NphR n=1 Tax=Corynebacterium occultum TaxID=2675219 RepID=A0A6B8WD54_9CORY|nr:helix-turn-helix domain-containing protein [Corynebacterium occultum]QGU08786.1 Transcriptional activator NphR [Corynebacterium occultum]